jgi:catechol 2,3-dioxygenase-like lactoylglutathione lyase family enzyme
LFKRLRYRLVRRSGGKLLCVDHITIPCGDLRTAASFYVGVLGAEVMLRVDKPLLERMGWSPEQIESNRAAHLSLTLGAGPRIDLFSYPEGEPRPDVVMHPHIAFMVPPGHYLDWRRRLRSQGVITTEITRPGPPGQASFYFNDPFGNHLEIVTLGFVDQELPPGVPDRSGLNYPWKPEEAALPRKAGGWAAGSTNRPDVRRLTRSLGSDRPGQRRGILAVRYTSGITWLASRHV